MALDMIANGTNIGQVNVGKLETDFLNRSVISEVDQNSDISTESVLYNMTSTIIAFLLTFMTILFNGSLLFCILKNKKKQWVRNARQITYLILSDFIIGVLLLPRIFVRPTEVHFSTCAPLSYIFITTKTVSFYHIMAVCIHRVRMAIQIHVPFNTDKYNYGRESLIIWIGVMLALIPLYTIWGKHEEIIHKCTFDYIFGSMEKGAKIYLLILYVIPWIITNVLYMWFLFKVRRSLKRVHVAQTDSDVSTQADTRFRCKFMNNHTCVIDLQTGACVVEPSKQMDSSTSQTAQANKKILRTVGFLLLTFNVSIVVSMAIILGLLLETPVPLIIYTFTLINNICNPFIYASASSTLKKETGRVVNEIISSFRC